MPKTNTIIAYKNTSLKETSGLVNIVLNNLPLKQIWKSLLRHSETLTGKIWFLHQSTSITQRALEGHTLPKCTGRYTWKYWGRKCHQIWLFWNKNCRGEDIHNNKKLPHRDHQLPGSLLTTKLPGTEQMDWPVVRHYHHFSSQKSNNCNNLKVIL